MSFKHTPVLYREILSNMRIHDDKKNIIIDMTLGLGGHASGIIQMLHPDDTFIGFDADSENLRHAQENIQKNVENISSITCHFVHSNFQFVKQELQKLGIQSITGAYADLGVSSAHFDDAKRGFSFRFEGPLDMRFNRESGEITARDILATYTQKELEDIFYRFGEEPKTRFIVDAIIKQRAIKPIETTEELAKLIEGSSFDPKSKLRVFQALRMEVNNELGVIKEALEDIIQISESSSRIEVITFHSLEDRLVKQIFHKYTHDIPDEFTGKTKIPKILNKIHKKPLTPTEEEVSQNPRSRSAKLRVVERT